MLYKVGQHEIELFKIRQAGKAIGVSNEAIRKKEQRGKVPTTIFRDKQGERLYSVEDIAMFEYFFKHLWSARQGVKMPDDLSEFIYRVFSIVRKEVLNNGRLVSEETLYEIPNPHKDFKPGILYSYILHWRAVLIEKDSFIDDILEGLL